MRLLIIAFLLNIASVSAADINILQFHARADGTTMNTKFIQAAIDRCSKTGGRVVVPAGRFLTGTLFLRERVEIFLEPGSELLGSSSFSDYPEIEQKPTGQRRRALIFAESVNHIAVTGTGTINGNGQSQTFQLGDDSGPKGNQGRPMLILMMNCRDVRIEQVQLKNSAFWMQSYVGCENLLIRGVNIYNHANWNNDAMDIDSKNVLIEDCVIDSDDDGLCLKSHDKNRPCENVTIRNCTVATNCNAIKFGTASTGGFRNIDISNIRIHKASVDRIRHWQEHLKFVEQPVTVIAGIALENVDGGVSDNITITNIFMSDVQTPIFIKFGNRLAARIKEGMTMPPPGRMRNITLNNITATSHSKITSSITGFPGYDIENLRMSNIIIDGMGLGIAEDGLVKAPENEKQYPENRMFGFVLPSSGLFLRHVNGVIMDNISLSTRNRDARTVVYMEDVKNADLSIRPVPDSMGHHSFLKLLDCQQVSWGNPFLSQPAKLLLEVEGSRTTGVIIRGDRGLANFPVISQGASVPAGAVLVR